MASPEDMIANLGPLRAGVLEGEEGASALEGYEAMQQQAQAGGLPTVPTAPPQPHRSGGMNYSQTPANRAMTQSKLSELFIRYGPEKDPHFMVKLYKLYPQKHAGDGGWVDDFHHPITEKNIRDLFPDGGRFKVVVFGSHPRTGDPGHEVASIIVDVASAPKPANLGRGGTFPWNRDRYGGSAPPTIVQPDNSAARFAMETLRDALASRESGKDHMIDQLRGLLDRPNSHFDASTIQSLIDANEAQKAGLLARHEAMMTEERERYNRDIDRLTRRYETQLEDANRAKDRSEEEHRRRDQNQSERFEREISNLRTQLEDERKESRRQYQVLTDAHKEELRRVENSKVEEVKRLQHDMDTRVQHAENAKNEAVRMLEKAKDSELSLERERSKMTTQLVSDNAKNQMETVARQAETSAAHLREIQSVSRSQIEFQLQQAIGERNKYQREADHYRLKSEESQDPINSVMRYKEVADTLGSLFGAEETSIVPVDSDDRSIWGRIERMMNSRFGQRAGEAAGAIAGTMFRGMMGAGQAAGTQGQVQIQQQPMAPTYRQPTPIQQGPVQGLPGQQMPQVQPYGQGPQPQGQAQQPQGPQPSGSMPTSADIDAQIEQALYGGAAGMPSPQVQTQPQPPATPAGPGPAHPALQGGPIPVGAPQAQQVQQPGPGQVDDLYAQHPPAGQPAPSGPTAGPAQVDQAAQLAQAQALEQINRVTRWVATIEQHIEANTPPEQVVDTLGNDLPPEAIQGFAAFPVAVVVEEILQGGIPNRGIINSERGVAYLTKVQAVVQQRMGG